MYPSIKGESVAMETKTHLYWSTPKCRVIIDSRRNVKTIKSCYLLGEVSSKIQLLSYPLFPNLYSKLLMYIPIFIRKCLILYGLISKECIYGLVERVYSLGLEC